MELIEIIKKHIRKNQPLAKSKKRIERRNMKFSKNEINSFNSKINYIRKELATKRHIIACLGSAGLTFRDDIQRFYEYALQNEELDISEELIKHCSFITALERSNNGTL
jgi:hypothetical protein